MTFASLLLALAVLAPGDEVVARVDGVEITRAAAEQRAAAFRAQRVTPTARQLADNLVEEAVLAAEAERVGLRADPAVARQLAADRRAVLADAFAERELEAAVEPPEELLRDLFHATGDFARFHLLTYATRAEADAAAARLRAGATVQDEAKKALTARVTAKDADLQLQMRAQIRPPEIVGPLFAARAGETLGPVALSTGFAVVRVVEVQIGPDEAFKARRAKIAEHARTQLASQGRAHAVARLRDAAGARLDEDFLTRQKGLEPTPAEQEHVIATVHGEPLRYREILPAVRQLAQSTGGHGMSGAVKVRVANQEIERRILAREAEARRYAERPEVAARLRVAERTVLANARANQVAREAAPPTPAEIRAFYDRNAKAYGLPFEKVKDDAAARVAVEKRSAHVKGHAAGLRKRARVSVDEKALKSLLGGDR